MLILLFCHREDFCVLAPKKGPQAIGQMSSCLLLVEKVFYSLSFKWLMQCNVGVTLTEGGRAKGVLEAGSPRAGSGS